MTDNSSIYDKITMQAEGRAAAMGIASHELAEDRHGTDENEAREWIDAESSSVIWNTSDDLDYNIGYLAGLHEIARAMDDGGWPVAVEALFENESRLQTGGDAK